MPDTPKIGERLYSYGKNATNFYALAERLKAHKDWHMGAMWAEYAHGPRTLDQLPQYRKMGPPYDLHASVFNATYIVYSYWTPIAWYDIDYGWVQPDVKYSQTTTNHQGTIAVALSVMDKV